MSVAPKVHPPIDPCPFCGDKGAEIDDRGDMDGDVWVMCECCGACGPVSRIGCRDDEFEDLDEAAANAKLELEAITMWNGAIARAEASEEE